MPIDEKAYLLENTKRRSALFSEYNPIRGIGSPVKRIRVAYTVRGEFHEEFFPREMLEKEAWIRLLKDKQSLEGAIQGMGLEVSEAGIVVLFDKLIRARLKYDFEYWAAVVAKIQDKDSKQVIPFILNKPQRKLLAKLEKMRLEGIPIRVIIVKARQWGGSTLTQLYMAWIQTQWKSNWHSSIVTDVENQARKIRGMYTRFCTEYPKELGALTMKTYEGSSKTRIIHETGCIIDMGSMQQPDSLRTSDFAMCHLSEVGIWKKTEGKSPEDLAQALRATVPDVPYSLIVMESTAKGVGNFFHNEWLAAIKGETEYEPVFVAWWEAERYQKEIKDMDVFLKWMEGNEYANFLWELGATLEGINWYFTFKKKKRYDDWRMQSEYPSSHQEAFQSTGRRVYPPLYVQKARATCEAPEFIGDITGKSSRGPDALKNIDVFGDPNGPLRIWHWPDKEIEIAHRYGLFVDIGGTTDKADWSVIRVLDRYWMIFGEPPVVAAVWRGHLDQDLVAWKAAQMGAFYNNGLVAVETNSLNTSEQDTEGSHYLTILNEIVEDYPHLYTRTDPEKVRQGIPVQWGFHMNTHTKGLLIDTHKAALREGEYIEKDERACDEMDTFELKANGKMGAVDGCKDDQVITAAGCTWLCISEMPMPYEVKKKAAVMKKIRGEATF